MSRRRRSDGERGFTLIEALVALAIIAAVLGSIGAVIGTAVQGIRTIEQRLALSGAAETVLAGLPARNALQLGRQNGVLANHRWRVDVAPIDIPADDTPPSRFVPLAVNMRMQGPGGAQIQVTTVRLVPNVAAEPGPQPAASGPKVAQ
ncbi:prepilin-type N-terminal cleavage/methylation domain-containing protein [Bradyrhizobium jicamae]|uniref:Prepilin-type N-terminal cleavage/methylation domain-containing protein n=1 Tax=Bradyrhizobium jicamae TaxID=280332 RepID=A0ABS5FN64_9BRAD|nr:prepilin-type N-terminal cleavage/methylation domain-containing protein [Bradyrhizobium jicamae]MBR0798247.1 prepilin-type N-terminal cleavage/methylation domain-containing protein [Bradyrhizobium jicamae]